MHVFHGCLGCDSYLLVLVVLSERNRTMTPLGFQVHLMSIQPRHCRCSKKGGSQHPAASYRKDNADSKGFQRTLIPPLNGTFLPLPGHASEDEYILTGAYEFYGVWLELHCWDEACLKVQLCITSQALCTCGVGALILPGLQAGGQDLS